MVSTAASLQSTTQKYLEIFDITNDLLMLDDGTCSLVMRTSAINFDLFSEEEQDATIYAYAALLNSLSFPIEIVIRSQKKDVTAYLDLLKTQEVKAYTPLKKKQIREYRAFVEQLVQERNVLDKKFYVIITASAVEMGILPPSTLVPGMKKPVQHTFDKYNVIEKAITILGPRRDHLIHQLARIGLLSEQLKTQELIQLFYGIYNPEAAGGQKIQNTSDYTTPMVAAQLRTSQETAPTPPITPLPEANLGTATQTPPTLPPTPARTAPSLTPAPTPAPAPTPPTAVSTSTQPLSSIKEDSFIINGSDLKPPTPPSTPPQQGAQ